MAAGKSGSAGDANGKRRPTLRDVAGAAGVSMGTASNAFNRPELLSEAMRERVLGEASRLGYAGPDPVARRLRTGRAGALGLIFTDRLAYAFEDQAAVIFVGGVARALEESGSGLLLIPTAESPEEGARVVRGAAVDGFIVFSSRGDDPRVLAALDRRLPTVVVDEPHEPPAPWVGIDDRAAARAAAAHLVELGHRRVAVVAFGVDAPDSEPLSWDLTGARLEGYREALGAAWDAGLLVAAPGTRPQTARPLLAGLLAADDPPTAVLAMSDALAAELMLEAAARGIDVPGQLSVVGFDDVPLAALADPPLTTVRQPNDEKGRVAARTLLDAVEADAPADPTRTLLPTELVVRESTAPPP
jgi:DNA-binding LacI/PurR family transcriptional regulator